ncbi:MAG TPA: GH92 family glycosyl hydrolase [Bacteroidales bacterium]|nr:GH92 family glycosyl hydrolase [Bacteroidales bacterium]
MDQKTITSSFILLLFVLLLFSGPGYSQEDDLSRWVNPFIGTHRMGHTYPGATLPFGMVQLSPETNYLPMYIHGKYNPEVYRYCSGYQYEDTVIYGFSHTHFSGTGHSDLGDFLLLPTTGSVDSWLRNNDLTRSSTFSVFSHRDEAAEPGYYRVKLATSGILAELTASERVGFHSYTFPRSDSANILLDLVYNIYTYEGKNIWTFVRIENDSTITGYRQTSGWARTRTLYFAIRFSKAFSEYGHRKYDTVPYKGFYRRFDESRNFPEMAGRDIRAWFRFQTAEGEQIGVRVALSSVSSAGALRNLEAEIPHGDFEMVRAEARQRWNRELARISVETLTDDDRVVFYTALYHTMLAPVLFEDRDGTYRGLDQEVHHSEGFTNYTVFSLWDTYRALHPLFNLIHPDRNRDMIASMLAHHDQSVHHMLPVWSHHANENWCMIGYHAVSVIADALVKGLTGVDTKRALQACINTSSVPYFDGLGDYQRKGYVPEDVSGNSVSKTLEFAYDDWCIAQIAGIAGDRKSYERYMQRAANYRHVFDPVSLYMRPRMADGSWRIPFDPLDTHGQGFIEGNAWNYGLYVPHNIPELIRLMGGRKRFTRCLDSIFETRLDDRYIEKNEDITRDGIIGAYVHGNEPGHHIPYLYNYAAYPWKTQARVRMIINSMYGSGPDGLCGNDDAGQMSAWYIFSSLGFYPVCPGLPDYVLGSPSVKNAVIRLQGNKTLSINVINQSRENIYVKRVLVNGKPLESFLLPHDVIMNGGMLIFEMSNTP